MSTGATCTSLHRPVCSYHPGSSYTPQFALFNLSGACKPARSPEEYNRENVRQQYQENPVHMWCGKSQSLCAACKPG